MPGLGAPQRPQPLSELMDSENESDEEFDPATANTESCFSTRLLPHFAQSVFES
jgi:hypothetical protein